MDALGGELSGEGFADPRRSAGHHGPGAKAGSKIVHAILLCEFLSSGRETLSEGDQQLEWPSEANLPPQESPHHVFFLPQKADPRLRVSGHVQIALADMPFLYADLLFSNHHSCLPLL